MTRAGDLDPDAGGAQGAWTWILDLAPAMAELDSGALTELAEFDRRLREHITGSASRPIPSPRHSPERRTSRDQPHRASCAVAAPADRVEAIPATAVSAAAQQLLALRRALAPGTVTGPLGLARSPSASPNLEPGTQSVDQHARVRAALAQAVRQFLAGYHDVDLRDVSGAGHGSMILRHGRPDLAAHWARRLDAGALAGIAMTEPRGGSRLGTPTTRLIADGSGRWRIHGAKRWISRLHEASVFVVSAAHPDGRTVAVAVDAEREGLTRQAEEPAGLRGWSWGALGLDGVPVDEDDLLTRDCSQIGPFAAHFAGYRQLITATALGAGAGVGAQVTTLLRSRTAHSEISRVGDHALITLATTDAALRASWHNCVHTARLAAADHPDAVARSAAAKAHGIDTARRAADDLAALAGASGFVRSHPIAKARSDLEALRFADGAHDSLRRHAGAALLASRPVADARLIPTTADGDNSR